MTSDWPEHRVSTLQEEGLLLVEDGNHGEYRPRRHEFGEGDTRFIRASDMDGGRVNFASADLIADTAVGRIRKGIGQGGDILFSHKGTVGKLALTPEHAPSFVCSPQTTFWRSLDEAALDRRFLYYYMQSWPFQKQWRSRKGETDMADYVSLTAQRSFSLPLPPISEQRSIARTLGTLDDKIELNREMNRTLEATAKAIFRSWFVDFDPVVAKADGRKPFGMTDETAALFPDNFVESELGTIPDGWRRSTIGEEVETVGGSTPPTKNPAYWEGGEVHWATPKDLSGQAHAVLLDTDRRITEAGLGKISSGLLPEGAVLMSSRAPVGYLAIAAIPTAVNQGFIAMRCEGRLGRHYVVHWARENMDEIKARAGGTTFAEISKRSFRPIPVVVPDGPVHAAWHEIADSLHSKVVQNLRESQTLSALRDLLLPKLLSGEIRVVEAQAAVEAAV